MRAVCKFMFPEKGGSVVQNLLSYSSASDPQTTRMVVVRAWSNNHSPVLRKVYILYLAVIINHIKGYKRKKKSKTFNLVYTIMWKQKWDICNLHVNAWIHRWWNTDVRNSVNHDKIYHDWWTQRSKCRGIKDSKHKLLFYSTKGAKECPASSVVCSVAKHVESCAFFGLW